MLYVYGVVDAAKFAVLPGEGLDAADVIAVSCGEFAAAVSMSPSGVSANAQNVRCHERVLERLMVAHTVLPMRFGTFSADVEALWQLLTQRAADILADLARLHGKVEMALLIADASDVIDQPMPLRVSDGRGTAYLQRRLQLHRREKARASEATRLACLLRQGLAPVVDGVDCTPAAISGYRVSCLIGRNRIAHFTAALENFAASHPQYQASMTGPWPPYSFVTEAPP